MRSTTCSTTGSGEIGRCRTARTVSPPPQGLSRGKRALSTSSTRAPAVASRWAVVEPAGPAPTTIASKCSIGADRSRPVESARLIDRIRVEPGHEPRIPERDPRDTVGLEDEANAKDRLVRLHQRLERLHARLVAEQAQRAARDPGHGRVREGRRDPGRDAGREPAGCRVVSFKAPAGPAGEAGIEQIKLDYRGWGREDSNLRRLSQRVYSPSPLATRVHPLRDGHSGPAPRKVGHQARIAPHALLAQLAEHLHGKEGVDGSSPSEGLSRRGAR